MRIHQYIGGLTHPTLVRILAIPDSNDGFLSRRRAFREPVGVAHPLLKQTAMQSLVAAAFLFGLAVGQNPPAAGGSVGSCSLRSLG